MTTWAVTLTDRVQRFKELWDEGRGMVTWDADDTGAMLSHLTGIWKAAEALSEYDFAWYYLEGPLRQLTEIIEAIAQAVRSGSESDARMNEMIQAMSNRAEETYGVLRQNCVR